MFSELLHFDFISDLRFLWLCSGVSRSAGGDAGDHQTAGGGSVRRPPPQRPVRDRAARVTTDQRRAEEESGRIPAEDPEGALVTSTRCCPHVRIVVQ